MFRPLVLALLVVAGCDDVLPVASVDAIVAPPRPVPRTETEIAFAAEVLNDLQPQSIAERREYCGLIGITRAGVYVATPARRGGASSCLPPERAGDGVTVLASYHTHAAYDPDYLTEIPSFDDIRTDIEDGTDGYIATPGGRFWYVDARARDARIICGAGCLVSDADYEEDPTFPVQGRYSLAELSAF